MNPVSQQDFSLLQKSWRLDKRGYWCSFLKNRQKCKLKPLSACNSKQNVDDFGWTRSNKTVYFNSSCCHCVFTSSTLNWNSRWHLKKISEYYFENWPFEWKNSQFSWKMSRLLRLSWLSLTLTICSYPLYGVSTTQCLPTVRTRVFSYSTVEWPAHLLL